jgi:hypothetical protein
MAPHQKRSIRDSERQLIADISDALRHNLADVPFARLEQLSPEQFARAGEIDAFFRLHLPEGSQILLIEAKENGQPRNVRHAVDHLLRIRERIPNAYPVFGARYVSPEAAEILSREGVGYVDLAGNSRLTLNRVYIRREGWPNKFVQRRELRSLYSPKAERVLRVLLLDPHASWRIEALAKKANVSLGQVSNVKRLLEDREWIRRDAEGLRLTQPSKVLEQWAQNYRFARNTVFDYYAEEPVTEVEVKLAAASPRLKFKYALTGFSAAARIAPMVRYQRATAYLIDGIDDAAALLRLKPVASGANVSLIKPYDDGVITGARETNGICITSPVQTYLDLLNFKGRGQEAAQAVFDKAIKPTW